MKGVEEADDVEAEIALEPDDVALGAVQDLDDARVGEHLVQLDERVADGRHERIDDPVAFARADLHQADEPDIRPKRVRLEVDGDLRRVAQMAEHLAQALDRVDVIVRLRLERRHRRPRIRRRRHLEQRRRPLALAAERLDLALIRMDGPAGFGHVERTERVRLGGQDRPPFARRSRVRRAREQ